MKRSNIQITIPADQDTFWASLVLQSRLRRVGHYHPTVDVEANQILVTLDLDPVPGWGHDPQDHADLLQAEIKTLGEAYSGTEVQQLATP